MFIGHYSVALAAATHPKAPALGTLFVAAQLVDIGFFSLVLADVEHMRVVPGITVMNPLDLYDMPWTHSLLGSLGWAAAFALVLRAITRSWTAAVLGGITVLSHWFIDLLVHRPDLTLAGSPPPYGLGLWNYPLIEMPLEFALSFGALAFYIHRTRPAPGKGPTALIVLAVAMAAFMAIDWFGPKPVELSAAIPFAGLTGYIVLAALAWWAGKTRSVVTTVEATGA